MEHSPAVERLENASVADVVAIAALLPQVSSTSPPDDERLRQILDQPGVEVLVARDEQRIVAMTTVVTFDLFSGTYAVIEDVVVDESARGRGLGSALVLAGIAAAKARGARVVDLTSRPSREAANRLYLRLGFERRETNVYRLRLDT